MKLQHNFISSLFRNVRPIEEINMCAVHPWPGLNQGRQFQIIKEFRSFFPPVLGIIDYLTEPTYYDADKSGLLLSEENLKIA